jgi:hypothetical protein
MQLSSRLCVAAIALSAVPSASACWSDAARRYGLSPDLLIAIARVESDLDPSAVNRSHATTTGTVDIGLMQINSAHLPQLARFGIAESDLYDPCVNIHVGAWVLAGLMARHGASWDAVGAYNAACAHGHSNECVRIRSRYVWKVYERLQADDRRALGTTRMHAATAKFRSSPPVIVGLRVSP